MSITNETSRAGNAADLLENTSSQLDAYAKNIKRKIAVPQAENVPTSEQFDRQPFLSFLSLVAENAAAPAGLAVAYLEICARLARVHDYDGYVVAGDNFLAAAREFAELHKLLKKPSIICNEAADRLENKAREIHNRAELFELEASHMRTAAAP
jgi:hypothetical protein